MKNLLGLFVIPFQKQLWRGRPPLLASTVASSIAVTKNDTSSFSTILLESQEPLKEEEYAIRPFHQNWWPVIALNALDETRPNPVEVLGMKLVAFQSKGQWSVLDDRCSHRFAPLSEGRVIQEQDSSSKDSSRATRLQCSYHGWEFDSCGICQRVPQDPTKVDKAKPVQTYPTRTAGGMLWVWTDPSSEEVGKTIRLPVSPLLEKAIDKYGNDFVFMRDLPYGMEILGENLLDLSHLPFSHHSVGSLSRYDAMDLPCRMVPRKEREVFAQWENKFRDPTDEMTSMVARYQAEIVSAAQHDPVFVRMAKSLPLNATKDWKTDISFFDPCHVRYRRTRGSDIGAGTNVELFLCPTSESRSRVFLFNLFEQFLCPPPKTTTQPGLKNAGQWFVPATWKATLMRIIFSQLIGPSPRGHMMAHQIFDGDGIFLHMQGYRMKKSGLTFRDYSTPTSADILLNTYRRFLESAATKTRQIFGRPDVAMSVVGSGQYEADLPRTQMLDRYNSHTRYCPICTRALKQTRSRKAGVKLLQTGLMGAAGTSILAIIASLLVQLAAKPTPGAVAYATISRTMLPTLCAIAGLSLFGTALSSKIVRAIDKKINQFLFEDYVHAEKN